MQNQIAKNLRAASQGGVPSPVSTVQGYVNMTLWRDNMLVNPNIEVGRHRLTETWRVLRPWRVSSAYAYCLALTCVGVCGARGQVMQDQVIWATVYFLLRSGKREDARDYIESRRLLFDAIEPAFQEYFVAYLDNNCRCASGSWLVCWLG